MCVYWTSPLSVLCAAYKKFFKDESWKENPKENEKLLQNTKRRK